MIKKYWKVPEDMFPDFFEGIVDKTWDAITTHFVSEVSIKVAQMLLYSGTDKNLDDVVKSLWLKAEDLVSANAMPVVSRGIAFSQESLEGGSPEGDDLETAAKAFPDDTTVTLSFWDKGNITIDKGWNATLN